MPLIHVSMARGRTDEQKRALLAAVTKAAQESIGAPLASIRVWITEFEGTDFMSAGKTLAERRAAEDQQ